MLRTILCARILINYYNVNIIFYRWYSRPMTYEKTNFKLSNWQLPCIGDFIAHT